MTTAPTSAVEARVRVATLDKLKAKGVVVVHGDDRPIAVFYNDGDPKAVDNRCPHMGFPMHQGTVRGGIVTCHWHEARFDLCSGCTFDLFADDLPAFDVAVEDDVVYVASTPRQQPGSDYYFERLQRGMEQNISLIQAKALVGLQREDTPLEQMVRFVAEWGCANHDNWREGMTSLTAVARLAPYLSDDTLYFALVKAVGRVAGNASDVAPRRSRHALTTKEHDYAQLTEWLLNWTIVRHRDGAERTLLTAVGKGADAGQLTDMLVGAATERPYASSGHVLDFCNKAMELLGVVGHDMADRALPMLLASLVSARGGEEQSSWRQPTDLIPPIREAEENLIEALEAGRGSEWAGESALSEALLGADAAAIIDAVMAALRDGAQPTHVARLICHAAAMRLARFAPSNDVRDWFNPLHTFTHCNAVYQSLSRSDSPLVARALLHTSISVYMDRFLNVPPHKLPSERPGGGGLDALPTQPRELLRGFLMALDQKLKPGVAAAMVSRYLHLGHPIQPLIDAVVYAVVREDLDFHALQLAEAAVNQAHQWPDGSDEIEHLFVAVAHYLEAHCPTQRGGLQTARIALRLHRGEAIYEEEA